MMRRDDDNGESVKHWVVVSNYRIIEACKLAFFWYYDVIDEEE